MPTLEPSYIINEQGDKVSAITSARTVVLGDNRSVETAITSLEASSQEKLISGVNIKTINNESLLGAGNITISGGSSGDGTTDHAELDNLDYDNSGHTGFASSNDFDDLVTELKNTFKDVQDQIDDRMQIPTGATTQVLNGEGNATDLKTVNGESIIGSGDIITDDTTDHALLSNLSYDDSGHIGFASSQDLSSHADDTDIHISISERVNLIRNKGFFLTSAALISEHPTPSNGDFAIIGESSTARVWAALNGVWADTGTSGTVTQADLQAETAAREALESDFNDHIADGDIHVTSQAQEDWNNKQDELVSGVNIKTINGNSLLGSGDITISNSGDYSGGTGAIAKSFEILVSDWEPSGIHYNFIWKADIIIDDLTSNDLTQIIADASSAMLMNEAHVLSGTDEFDGYVRIYSRTIPSDTINGVVLITKGGKS